MEPRTLVAESLLISLVRLEEEKCGRVTVVTSVLYSRDRLGRDVIIYPFR